MCCSIQCVVGCALYVCSSLKLLTVESPTDTALADALAEGCLACDFRRRVVLLSPRSCSAAFCEVYSTRTCEASVPICSSVRSQTCQTKKVLVLDCIQSWSNTRAQAFGAGKLIVTFSAAVRSWFRSKFSFKAFVAQHCSWADSSAIGLCSRHRSTLGSRSFRVRFTTKSATCGAAFVLRCLKCLWCLNCLEARSLQQVDGPLPDKSQLRVDTYIKYTTRALGAYAQCACECFWHTVHAHGACVCFWQHHILNGSNSNSNGT